MSIEPGRYGSASAPQVATGWTLQRLTPPSRLFGAHGMAPGPDGRLYVAQLSGSQVSAVDINSGAVENISPMGGEIIGPDDLAFDGDGNMYVAELTENRVSMTAPDGKRSILADVPVANPVTTHQGRVFTAEFRQGGRIIELYRDGRAPRPVLENVSMVNGFAVGPEGKLYFPVMSTNEIWRIDLEGGEPEVVTGGLGRANSVKFDAEGFIVSTQVGSGQVLRIDPRTGDKTLLVALEPGLDNCAFVDGRLFVSSISGQIREILGPGRVRELLPDGLQWPMGMAVDANRTVFAVDGTHTYTFRPGGPRELAGMLFTPGYPGFVRGAAAAGADHWIVTTANGQVTEFWPLKGESRVLASGYDKLMGVALAPGGGLFVAESGTRRVLQVEGGQVTTLADGLDVPMGVAAGPDGSCYVVESGAGRVTRLAGGRTETVLDGLSQPEGIALHDGRLYVVGVGDKTLVEVDLQTGARRVVVSGLPVGAPPGAVRKYLGSLGALVGPMVSFAGIASDADGVLYVAADAEGSVMAIRPDGEGDVTPN